MPGTDRSFRRVPGLLAAALVLAAGPAATEEPRPETESMNVLFINVEDCRADVWGCYGNTICETPNIDRLARTGVRFDRAYCQAVSCNPSRTSYLTGLRPETTGVFTAMYRTRRHMPAEALTLPQLAKRAGFYTINVGKLFHREGTWNAEDMRTFDRIEFQVRPSGWSGPDPILEFAPIPEELAGPPRPERGDSTYVEWRTWHMDRYGSSGLTDDQEMDGRYARTAVALLREMAREGRRFFLTLGSRRPHAPLLCPQEWIDRYDPDDVPPPPAPREQDDGVPDVAVRFGRSADIFVSRDPTPREAREAIAAYYACVSFLDAQLGLVLDALDETGLAANTIVVFLSDHGFQLGEHGHWSKYTLFEQTTRVPLIVRVPGNPENGRHCDEIVELVDLVPTLGELVGLELPDELEGRSLVPFLSDPARPGGRAAFTTAGPRGEVRSVRTKRWRYSEWAAAEGTIRELYDLDHDPWETVNLADRPEQREQQQRMAALLAGGWRSARP